MTAHDTDDRESGELVKVQCAENEPDKEDYADEAALGRSPPDLGQPRTERGSHHQVRRPGVASFQPDERGAPTTSSTSPLDLRTCDEDKLDDLLNLPLQVWETYEQRTEAVLKATARMSERERILAILEYKIPKVTLVQPRHHPGILLHFVKNHAWLYSRKTSRGVIISRDWSPVLGDALHYAFLIEEMNKRGGNLNAARSIVKEEYVEGVRNIWYWPPHAKAMSRHQAAGKVLTFYQRNRHRMIKRIEKQLSEQFGNRWICVPHWAARLKVVQDVLSKAPPREERGHVDKGTWDPVRKMMVAPIRRRNAPTPSP
jgi:hypothetical protein